jgi:GTPase SAR1 family protein
MVVNVNVAIIGDEGSGKTSLVLSAAQRTFRLGDSVPVLPPTAFRVKLANEECNCVCRDSSSGNMEDVKAVIRQCDVVLICFNMAGQTSLHSAIHIWLPRVSDINKEVPVIMVGCKEDQAVITQTQIAVRTCPCSMLVRVL